MDQQVGSGSLCFAKAPFNVEQHLWLEPRGRSWQMHLTVSDRMINLVSRHGRPQRAVCRKKH